MRLKQLVAHCAYVDKNDMTYRPYGIANDGKLALSLFYILGTLAFTFYVEFMFSRV